ncbi:MAG: helix-turn-helix domain-containing protein [Proteobacteria bacterium]|nr:helix-turn-helix domain-containing protein [Pseudomonadota bacterium]
MKKLDDKTYYQALKTHDRRFDGHFFVGVTSTGIYCRPICTVKTPKPQNCRFFSSAAIAENHGFRPCLRCRPELAPGNSDFERSANLARSAATMIEDGFLHENSIELLAESLGVTDRHLRRVFQTEYGVSIVDHVQTQRLLTAKQLLTDTMLPITEVAFASGFASIRRFNIALKERYGMQPSALRKRSAAKTNGDFFVFELGYRPPYDWHGILSFLSERTIEGVEYAEGDTYIRSVSIVLDEKTYNGWLEVSAHRSRPYLILKLSPTLSRVIPVVLTRIKRLFDLACNPTEIGVALKSLKAVPGLRVPGAFDGFEMAVRAVLGQQVTVKAARTLAGRITERFGSEIETAHAKVSRVFPSASEIASVPLDKIIAIGLTRSRANCILSLAKAVHKKEVILTSSADVNSTIEALLRVPGIGEWTSQYIAMRALSWPDAFPHTDLGVRKALGETSSSKILALADVWKPWRAYATMALWQSLKAKPRLNERGER